MKIKYLIAIFLLMTNVSFASDAPTNDTLRFIALTKEIRCIVCQNQSLAESTAPIANDLRNKIETMILQKKSDEEIKDYLVKRYGEFILLRPRYNPKTYFLWLFPLIGMISIGYFFLRPARFVNSL